MKKTKAVRRNSAPKRAGVPQNVDEYLASVPEPARSVLSKLREAIRAAVPPEAAETISYRIPAIKHDKKIVVWFAAFAKHCSLFPTAAVIAEFQKDLRGYTISKGTIQFPLDQPLPVALIQKIVKARLAQNARK